MPAKEDYLIINTLWNRQGYMVFVLFWMLLLTVSLSAQEDESNNNERELGILKCTLVRGSRINLLVTSTVDLKCVFDNQGIKEYYLGRQGIALGLDLDLKRDKGMTFMVIADKPDVKLSPYALTAEYLGTKAEKKTQPENVRRFA